MNIPLGSLWAHMIHQNGRSWKVGIGFAVKFTQLKRRLFHRNNKETIGSETQYEKQVGIHLARRLQANTEPSKQDYGAQ